MSTKEARVRYEAEYKARLIFIDLQDSTGGDNALMISGLSIAMNTIKNDLVALLPKPAAPAVQPPEPAKNEEKPVVPPEYKGEKIGETHEIKETKEKADAQAHKEHDEKTRPDFNENVVMDGDEKEKEPDDTDEVRAKKLKKYYDEDKKSAGGETESL